MAPREDLNAVREEIDSGIEAYNYEKNEHKVNSDEIIDPNYEWNEMMKTSKLLKQKYSFLSEFMDENRINVVKEENFDDKILDSSGKITFYEDDSNGTVYYIVQNNGEIIKVPYEQIDRTGDFEVTDNGFDGEQLGDYVDENTTHILQHDYDSYGNDNSPLYVIPFLK